MIYLYTQNDASVNKKLTVKVYFETKNLKGKELISHGKNKIRSLYLYIEIHLYMNKNFKDVRNYSRAHAQGGANHCPIWLNSCAPGYSMYTNVGLKIILS